MTPPRKEEMRMKKEKGNGIRGRTILNDLELENAFGYPVMKLCGDSAVSITGVCRIESYSKEEITVDLDKLKATFFGKALHLVCLTESAVRIDGRIESVSLERVRRDGR